MRDTQLNAMNVYQVLLWKVATGDQKTRDKTIKLLDNLVKRLHGVIPVTSARTRRDREKVAKKLEGFDPEKSPSVAEFKRRGWYGGRRIAIAIGIILANMSGLEVHREEKRRKKIMFKFLDDHFDEVKVHFDHIWLEPSLRGAHRKSRS